MANTWSNLNEKECQSLCSQYDWCYYTSGMTHNATIQNGNECLLYIYPLHIVNRLALPYISGFSNNVGSLNPIFKNDFVVGTTGDSRKCWRRNNFVYGKYSRRLINYIIIQKFY